MIIRVVTISGEQGMDRDDAPAPEAPRSDEAAPSPVRRREVEDAEDTADAGVPPEEDTLLRESPDPPITE